jgi:hypothetical protein
LNVNVLLRIFSFMLGLALQAKIVIAITINLMLRNLKQMQRQQHQEVLPNSRKLRGRRRVKAVLLPPHKKQHLL